MPQRPDFKGFHVRLTEPPNWGAHCELVATRIASAAKAEEILISAVMTFTHHKFRGFTND